jgi:3-deoxy-7-phosphoheptulonate synthase
MADTNGSSNGSSTKTPEWTPDSWRSKPVRQSPDYPNKAAVTKSVAELKRLPPIVHPREIVRLKEHLRDVARGEAFLLQGGDCAELFDYCEQNAIESKIKLLLQMSLVLIWGADRRIVRIGRMAGQYAKPRSSPMEMVDGKQVPSFRGDILNGYQLDERELDPQRLVKWVLHYPPEMASTLTHIGPTTTPPQPSTTSAPPSPQV